MIIPVIILKVVLLCQSHCMSSPGSFDACRLCARGPPTLTPSQLTWAVNLLVGYYVQYRHLLLLLILKDATHFTVGYDGTHGGYGFVDRNADGSRILEFADGLNLVICNTLFAKQESKLVTYVAGSAKSTVDWLES